MPTNTWTSVEISQLLQPDNRYKYAIKVGDSVDYDVINNDAREFTNVTAYIGSTLYTNPPAIARIDNLNITTFPDGERREGNFLCYYNNYNKKGSPIWTKPDPSVYFSKFVGGFCIVFFC